MKTHTTSKQIALNVEQGNLPSWACQQAERLAALRAFQPGGHTCVGFSNATRKIKRELCAAGIGGNYLERVMHDIIDLAYLNGRVA